jgi:hypothetical protein
VLRVAGNLASVNDHPPRILFLLVHRIIFCQNTRSPSSTVYLNHSPAAALSSFLFLSFLFLIQEKMLVFCSFVYSTNTRQASKQRETVGGSRANLAEFYLYSPYLQCRLFQSEQLTACIPTQQTSCESTTHGHTITNSKRI